MKLKELNCINARVGILMSDFNCKIALANCHPSISLMWSAKVWRIVKEQIRNFIIPSVRDKLNETKRIKTFNRSLLTLRFK